MFARIVTTITTDIDLETFTPSHSVEIEPDGDRLPTEVIYAAVAGGCKATLNSLPQSTRDLAADDEDES